MSKIYRVELQKVTSVHKILEDHKYKGTTIKLPNVGECFGLWLDGATTDNAGGILTTEVKEVTPVVDNETGKKALIFKTKNSIYSLAYEEYNHESAIQKSATVSQKEDSASSAS